MPVHVIMRLRIQDRFDRPGGQHTWTVRPVGPVRPRMLYQSHIDGLTCRTTTPPLLMYWVYNSPALTHREENERR